MNFTRTSIITFLITVCLLILYFNINNSNFSNYITIKNCDSERVVKTIRVDFGLIQDYRVREKKFTVQNNLSKPIRLKPVSSSCGCVSLKSATTALPNTTDFVKVLFNPIGQKGKERQKAGMDIDRGNISHVSFEIIANVSPAFEYSPHLLIFVKNAEQDLSKNIHIILKKRPHFFITKIVKPKGYELSHKLGDKVLNNSTIMVTQKKRNSALDIHEIRIEGDKGEIIRCDIIEREQKYFNVKPSTVHYVVSDSTSPYQINITIQPNFITPSVSELHYQSPFAALSVQKKKKKYDNQEHVISLYELHVSLSANDINETTRSFIQFEMGGLEQRIPVWITKIDY